MAVQILRTKLRIPPVRSNRVIRPRLYQKLEDGLCQGHSLLLVTAPAGFGKTTLVSDWAARIANRSLSRSRPAIDSTCHDFTPLVAWLALDGSDNDPYRFWTYVLEALREARRKELAEQDPGRQVMLGETVLASLQSPSPAPVEVLVGELINELAGRSKDFLLVLDDYHQIRSPEVHDSLSFLIDHQPDNVVLVILTRSTPPLPLARLRGRFQMTEIDKADLRFSSEEVRSFLQTSNGLDLPDQAMEALEDRTEGWAAGLQLAALALRQRSAQQPVQAIGAEEVIRTFSGSHRYVLSYLSEEVLKRQPDDVRGFLVETAFLDELSADLCAAVTGSLNSEACQRILEYLDDNNLFIVPLDEDRQWFRYHSLFAGFLRARMEELGEAQVRELRRRAAGWYAGRGWWEKAVEHALASGNGDAESVEAAADWMEEVVREQVVSPPALLKSFPPEVLRARPLLAVAFAINASLEKAEPGEEVERWLQAAESALAAQREKDAREGGAASETLEALRSRALVEGHILLTRGTVARENHRYQQALEYCLRALEVLPPEDYVARSSAALTMGHAYLLLGDSESAMQAAEQAWQYALAGRSPARIFVTAYNKQEYALNRNHLREAEQISLEALRVVETIAGIRGLWVPEAGAAYLGLARIHLARHELDAAEEEYRRGSKLIQLSGQVGIAVDVRVIAYFLAFMRRDWAAVQQSLRSLGLYDKSEFASHRAYYLVRLWLSQLEEEPDVLPNLLDWLRQSNFSLASGAGEDAVAACVYENYQPFTAYLLTLIAFYRLGIAAPGGAQGGGAQGSGAPRRFDMADLRATVERTIAYARKAHLDELVLDLTITLALACQAEAYRAGQRPERALAEIEKALGMAEPEGIMMQFVIHGRPMAELLQLARQDPAIGRRYAGFLSRLTACFPAAWLEGETAPPGIPAAPLVEPLSEREIEVLRLLAAGRSNREIAADLVLALGTVKKHVNNIFGKMGVANRTEAALKARELGITE